MNLRNILHILLLFLIVGPLSRPAQAAPKRFKHSKPPDLTQGGRRDDLPDRNLGPTGARGWNFSRKTSEGASRESRQILVTGIDGKGPAAGKLFPEDVIVGVDGSPFSQDARKALAEAILEAEAGNGQIKLLVWRLPEFSEAEKQEAFRDYREQFKGKAKIAKDKILHGDLDPALIGTSGALREVGIDEAAKLSQQEKQKISQKNRAIRLLKQSLAEVETEVIRSSLWPKGKAGEVVLTIPVLGAFSETSPFDCPKTEKLIDMACEQLRNKPMKEIMGSGIHDLAALGLLSTGRPDLMPKLREYAHSIAPPDLVVDVEKGGSKMAWTTGYKLLFLTEYFLATKDDYVLPAIRELAVKTALGQSKMGTWSHIMAYRSLNDGWHGPLPAYGEINQTSISLMLGLVLAEKCGVRDAELTRAIGKGRDHFAYFIGRGAIPYGRHAPIKGEFDDNGKSAAAGVLFDLMGNREGAEFFAAMTLGQAPSGREAGHQGCTWSHYWGGMGVARGGRDAIIAYHREMRWVYTLERRWDGTRAGQGPADGSADYRWEETGTRLIHLTLHKKNLHLTGKDMTVGHPLGKPRIAEILNAGRLNVDPAKRKALAKGEIVAMLGDELPPVRETAAEAIEDQELEMVDELVAMLGSENRFARYGACQALARAGHSSEKAVAALIEVLRVTDDPDLVHEAVDAVTSAPRSKRENGLLLVSAPAVPALLGVAAKSTKLDPAGKLGDWIIEALEPALKQGDLFAEGGVNRDLLVPALRDLFKTENAGKRGRACVAIYPHLRSAQLKQLWPDILRSSTDYDDDLQGSGTKARVEGLSLLASHGMAEGIEVARRLLEHPYTGRWNQSEILAAVSKYGASAKPLLPLIEKLKPGSPAEKKLQDGTIRSIKEGKPADLKNIAPR